MVVAHQPEREAMPFAQSPDAQIWWDQSGTGDAVLLIMGHAYGADMWHRTAPELAASYRVIRFDNRGVGRSSDPPGPYPVQLMAGAPLAVRLPPSTACATPKSPLCRSLRAPGHCPVYAVLSQAADGAERRGLVPASSRVVS